jgi:hypothetical protein
MLRSNMVFSAFAAVATAAAVASAPYDHVIALSVDGLHGSDIDKYLAVRPKSNLASLLSTGIVFNNSYTSAVSLPKADPIMEADC